MNSSLSNRPDYTVIKRKTVGNIEGSYEWQSKVLRCLILLFNIDIKFKKATNLLSNPALWLPQEDTQIT